MDKEAQGEHYQEIVDEPIEEYLDDETEEVLENYCIDPEMNGQMLLGMMSLLKTLTDPDFLLELLDREGLIELSEQLELLQKARDRRASDKFGEIIFK